MVIPYRILCTIKQKCKRKNNPERVPLSHSGPVTTFATKFEILAPGILITKVNSYMNIFSTLNLPDIILHTYHPSEDLPCVELPLSCYVVASILCASWLGQFAHLLSHLLQKRYIQHSVLIADCFRLPYRYAAKTDPPLHVSLNISAARPSFKNLYVLFLTNFCTHVAMSNIILHNFLAEFIFSR